MCGTDSPSTAIMSCLLAAAGQYLNNSSRPVDLAVGGWSTSGTFVAQTGIPFTVTNNNSTAAGGSARAHSDWRSLMPPADPLIRRIPPLPAPQTTRNKIHWYNPCAFANPLAGNSITTPVTSTAAAIAYLGGKSNLVYGPGYNRVNMSLFKNFSTWREQYLQFRADAFNLFNHPSLANPSLTGVNSTGGQITGPKNFQNDTPDARFFQLSLKYTF